MEKKSVFKNSMYNMFYKGFTALFPLLTTTYISRILLAEGVGKVSYANTIVMYFLLVASLGIPFYGVKVIAQNYNDKKKLTTSFMELFSINAIMTTFCIVAYYIVINYIPYFETKIELLNVFGLLLIFNYFNLDWFYQGIEEYSYIATRSIIIKIISFVLMVLFVKTANDVIIYSIILCIATAGNNILNLINLRKYLSKEFEKINILPHLKPNIIMLVSVIAQELYSTIDTLMLEHFYGDSYVGYYTNSVKVIKMVYTLSIAMVTAFYPRISQYIGENKKEECNNLITLGTKIILLISIPASIGIALTSRYSVPIFFGNSFIESVLTIKFLSILIIVFSLSYFLGHVILMAVNKEKNILLATTFGAFVNLILNLILIPLYKHNGASIASVCSEVIVMGLLIYNSKKYFKLNIDKKFISSLFNATIVMTIYVLIISLLIKIEWLGMLLSVFGGVLIYLGILYALKNDMIYYFLQIIKKKIRGKNI